MLLSDEVEAREFARQLALEVVPIHRSVTSPEVAVARAKFVSRVVPARFPLFDQEAAAVLRGFRHHVMLFGSPAPKPPGPPPPDVIASGLVVQLVIRNRAEVRACASVAEMMQRLDAPIREARAAFLATQPFGDVAPFEAALAQTLREFL